MIRIDERVRLVLVIVVSVLLVAGTSFALKMLERDGGAGQSRYDRVSTKYAGLGKPAGYARTAGGCTYSEGSGGGCNSSGPGGSSCCGGGGAPLSQDEVKAGVLRYYAEKYGDSDVTCVVKDYGCHMEAEILKDGNVVRKLSISGNRITEIG
jgi:hypothetical protein